MIRAGRAEDAAKMGVILSNWIDDTAWMPRLHTRAQDQGFCRGLIKTKTTFVAEVSDQVVGFLALDDHDIDALYLAKSYCGQGIGTSLLDAAKAQADHLTLWTFVANTGAQKFYTREGFVHIQSTDGAGNDENLPDIQFKWSRTI